MKPFAANEYPTIGVEEEFHLIDPSTAELAGRCEEVMAALDGRRTVCYEVFLSVLEANSAVARTADELVADVIAGRRELDACCRQAEVRLVASASHPFSDYRAQEFVPAEHYQWVQANHGIIAHRLLSFALHVHVGLRSAGAALYVMRQMRRWVYPLLAMSANSPFLDGRATGLMSVRTHLFNGMPRTLFPPPLADFAELEAHYERLLAAGDVTRPGDLWWNIRPQPPLGTLEIRTPDLPTDVHRIGAIAAVYQAAAARYQDDYFAGRPVDTLRDEYLMQNRWRAMRDGLAATILEPQTGEVVGMRAYLRRLLDLAAPKAAELGGERYLERARRIVATDNEAAAQLELRERFGGDLRRVELELARRTVSFDAA